MIEDPVLTDPHLKWIAKEWEENAKRLATWGIKHIVNRFDVWGQYSLKTDGIGQKIGAVTLPVVDLRGKGDHVTHNKLTRHFKGKKPNDLIGLHCTSAEETCRWFAVDVDVHEKQETSYLADQNFEAMKHWHKVLRDQMLDPVILDTNGMGSFHLWVLLNDAYPLSDVFGFLTETFGDYREIGLTRKPEYFPSSEKLDGLGKWLRLPGRHHTHLHFTKVWTDEDGEGAWLEGVNAIEYLMTVRPMPLPSAKKKLKKPGEKKPEPDRRKTICVDLDGVLAKYDGFKGVDNFGDPIPGARDFVDKLNEYFEVIIYTARFSNERIETTDDVYRLKNLIGEWLDKHDFEYSDVFDGVGKPLAYAYIDDHAINCKPLKNDGAFEETIDRIETLLGKN